MTLAVFLALPAARSLAQDQPVAPAERSPSQRRLAPGVLTVMPPEPQELEAFSGPLPLVELVTGKAALDWSPNYTPKTNTLLEKAKKAILRREIWNLEFAFKPLRMLEVDVPQPTGRMQQKRIWYMVYRLRYLGNELNPTAQKDPWGHETFPTSTRISYQSRRFFPHFVLESHEFGKSYLDRIIPAAQRPIELREAGGAKLHNSAEIMRVPIPLSTPEAERSVWGVVTWEDVDPRIDFFSVFIRGLTNAYRFEDPPGAYKAGDPPGTGRVYAYKTLQLNFWRPGDTEMEHENEIRFGVPIDSDPEVQAGILAKYGLDKRLDHLWIYR